MKTHFNQKPSGVVRKLADIQHYVPALDTLSSIVSKKAGDGNVLVNVRLRARDLVFYVTVPQTNYLLAHACKF